MATFDEITNEAHLALLGFTRDQEQLTLVTSAVASGDLTIPVTDASQLSVGITEIEDELVWVSSIDPDANVATILLRGLYGTTPAAHAPGAIVRNNPKYPRSQIKRAINSTILSSYPDLFAVGSTQLTANGVQMTFGLPADAEMVTDVSWDAPSPTQSWVRVRRYDVDLQANTTDFPTGRSLRICDGVTPGRTIQVSYRRKASTLSAGSDLLSASGLDESAKECLIYGACSKLVGYTEPSAVSDDAAEARFIDGSPAGQALAAGRYFYQLYLQAKSEEARRLLDRYPARIHFTR